MPLLCAHPTNPLLRTYRTTAPIAEAFSSWTFISQQITLSSPRKYATDLVSEDKRPEIQRTTLFTLKPPPVSTTQASPRLTLLLLSCLAQITFQTKVYHPNVRIPRDFAQLRSRYTHHNPSRILASNFFFGHFFFLLFGVVLETDSLHFFQNLFRSTRMELSVWIF